MFAAALLPRLFGTNPRSHHKGATGRVRTGDQRLPILCHCQLGQDIIHSYEFIYKLKQHAMTPAGGPVTARPGGDSDCIRHGGRHGDSLRGSDAVSATDDSGGLVLVTRIQALRCFCGQ